jgi:hypothetical protein
MDFRVSVKADEKEGFEGSQGDETEGEGQLAHFGGVGA